MNQHARSTSGQAPAAPGWVEFAAGAATEDGGFQASQSAAIDRAVGLHQEGRFAEAEKLYRWILEATPEHAAAQHWLGVLLHRQERSDAALELVRRSIALASGHADWHNNLGNILAERDAPADAALAFQASIALDPANATVWNNLGAVLQRLQRFDDAADAYRSALALHAEFPDALYNLGNLLALQGRNNEAAEYYCRAFVLGPCAAKSKHMLGIAYYKLGRIAEAAETYRQWLIEEPGNPVAAHLYAACSGRDVPPRAADAYIEATFDDNAENFDAKLIQRLSYRGPELIGAALAAAPLPDRPLNGLDAGCGTGLCAAPIAPYLARLTGVDLSSRMLAVAAQRGVYDELVKGELTGYLSGNAGAFDLIVIADTLSYFGALDDVFAAAFDALREDGLLLFTVEEAKERSGGAGHRLNPNGRYCHDSAYLQSALARAGFAVLAAQPGVLRVEFGVPVEALAITARKPARQPGYFTGPARITKKCR